MSYLWVALGSALGGVARHGCGTLAARWLGIGFPWGTLLVNVSGSLLIGFLAGLAAPDGRMLLQGDVRAFVMIGLLGGFTTFSSFSLETLQLARAGGWALAAANVLGSVVACLAAVYAGHAGAVALQRL